MLAYLLKSSAFSFFQLVLKTGSCGEQTFTLTQWDKSSSIEMARVTLLQQYQQQQDLAVPRDAQQRHLSTASSPVCSQRFLPRSPPSFHINHTGLAEEDNSLLPTLLSIVISFKKSMN